MKLFKRKIRKINEDIERYSNKKATVRKPKLHVTHDKEEVALLIRLEKGIKDTFKRLCNMKKVHMKDYLQELISKEIEKNT